MTTRDQLLMSRYMEKQALSMLGETGTEQGLNAFSMLPGVGFLGNIGSGVYNMARGRFGRGLADMGMGAASFATGGASNLAMKGLRAGGMFAKPLMKFAPTFTRGGVGMAKGLTRAGQGIGGGIKPLNSFAQSGAGSFLKKTPLAHTATQIGGNTYKSMESGSNMAPQNKTFDALTSGASSVGGFMGSGGADPRDITPGAIPAPVSNIFS